MPLPPSLIHRHINLHFQHPAPPFLRRRKLRHQHIHPVPLDRPTPIQHRHRRPARIPRNRNQRVHRNQPRIRRHQLPMIRLHRHPRRRRRPRVRPAALRVRRVRRHPQPQRLHISIFLPIINPSLDRRLLMEAGRRRIRRAVIGNRRSHRELRRGHHNRRQRPELGDFRC